MNKNKPMDLLKIFPQQRKPETKQKRQLTEWKKIFTMI